MARKENKNQSEVVIVAKGKYQDYLTKDGLIKLEGWARDGLTDEQIAHNIGIERQTLYDWKNKYPDISDALKKGKEVVDYQVENALLKRALGYKYTETTRERIVDTGQKKRHGGESELTEAEWEMTKAYFDGKCCYCGNHIELTKDHMRPLKKDGVMSWSNILPACRSCNSSKKDNEWLSWFQKQKFYSAERVQKIMDFISFVATVQANKSEEREAENMVVTKEVTKEVVPDVTAQIFWLKNRKPGAWREKSDVTITQKKSDTVAEMEAYIESLKENDSG